MTVAHIEAAGSLPERMRYAQALAASNLLPQTYRDHPANVLVAMEVGAALGIAPIVAINEVNVISGKPALSASLMAALARQAGHKVRTVGDSTSATCTIVRADDPGFSHVVTWDERKARANGLWGKGHWQKSPDVMLAWRAISECVRMACSEVLAGIKYTPDELSEGADTSHTVTATVPPVAQPQAEPAAEKEEAAPAADTSDPKTDLRTSAQSAKLAILIKENDLQRDEALRWMSGLIGHDIGSTKELTKAEASTVIDALETAKKDGASPTTGEVVQAELVEEDPWVVTGK
jgi:hypothetical protein